MPRHHMQHARNMGSILFARNENNAHVMPFVTACAVTSCAHRELLMDMPFTQAELYLSKITASHFSTLNMKITNQNVLKRILIAMLNENKADSLPCSMRTRLIQMRISGYFQRNL